MPPGDGSGASGVAGESSDSTFQLNIKTLDSRIFSFHVDKNILVSTFKEKIASQVSVPVGQQRLIFRGKVLKDEHRLSEYNVEHGDTLHLVERQPQPPPGTNTREATSGNDSSASGHIPIGQIAHSVMLGTLHVGDQGDAVVPDLSRVIGAVLNSIAIGNLPDGMQPGVQTPHGNGTERSQANASGQVQGGHSFGPYQALHGQSAFNPMQNPLGTATAVPSLNMPIPNSLNTLNEFMNQMESVLSQNGTPPIQSPTTLELPINSHGFPTVEALTTVLRHAQRLISDQVVPALAQTSGRLDQEGGSSDPAIRGQVQTESVQLGVAMQHLGALLLELGRTILTLRIDQSSGGSFLNSGPAVYISPSGPNPIMVQPFPLQTSSLFGGSGVTPTHYPTGPFGSIMRNVNIHIHTGASLAPIVPMVGNRAPNGEEIQGQVVNGAPGEFGRTQAPSGVNVPPTAVPLRPAAITVSGAALSQASDPSSVSSIVADINAQLRNVVAQRQSGVQASTGGAANQEQPGVGDNDTSSHQRNLSSSIAGEVTQTSAMDRSSMSGHAETLEGPSGSSQRNNSIQAGSSGVPLGLGLGGGLQPKRQAKSSDDASSSRAVGQQVLQSLASLSTRGDANLPSSGQHLDLARGVPRDMPTTRQDTNDNIDVAVAMSQALGSSSLDGLLAGVSQQTGVGTPDMLRNMLQQFTQNPAMRNTMNQMAQQMEGQDLGSMFSGGGEGGGGFDLSRMMQQMMPIVSQALGGISSGSQLNPPQEQVLSGNSSRRDTTPTNDDRQIDLRQVVRRLSEESSPEEILYNLVIGTVRLSNSGGNAGESLGNALSSESGLAQDFMDMLLLDLSRRLEEGV